MKLERAHEYVTTVVAVGIGILTAYYMGTLSGTGRFGIITGMLASAGFLALLLASREQVWLLIPFSTQLVGQVEELRGHPAIHDLAVWFVFAGIFSLRAFKIIRRKPAYQPMDFWTWAVLLYLVTVYVRNPVGGEALGSDRVGGRPYLDVFTATLAYWVLARVALPSRFAVRAFFIVSALTCSASLLYALQVWFPVITPLTNPLIGGASPDIGDNDANAAPAGEDLEGRKIYLAGVGLSLSQFLLAAYPPLSLLNPLRVVRFLLFATALLSLLLSGFRSDFFGLGCGFLIATYLRHNLTAVMRLAGVSLLMLTLLLIMQGTVINLPFPVQRTLSFLPGKWDANVLVDADASASWRIDMWQRMLGTDRYIENKWLGDGFGITALQLAQSKSSAGSSNTEQQQENFLVTGMVHSGPVSTIRYVGYVGLFLFLCYLIALARESWVLCRECKGTPYFMFSLFIGVPIIYQPLGFVLVFGAYQSDLPVALVACGMLKMLRTSLKEYRAQAVEPDPIPIPVVALPPVGGRPLPAHLQY